MIDVALLEKFECSCNVRAVARDQCTSVATDDFQLLREENSACSASSGSFCGKVGGTTITLRSLHLAMDLGHCAQGTPAGKLRLSSEEMTPALATRGALDFTDSNSGVEIIEDTGGARQVLSADGFADLATIDDYQYEVRFYRRDQAGTKQGGLYVPVSGAEPFKVVRVANPDASPSIYNRLMITETSGAVSVVSQYAFSFEDGWSLSKGSGLRYESREDGTLEGSQRYETVTVREASGAVVRQAKTVYDDLICGERVTQTIEDPTGVALTTTRTYYTNPADTVRFGQPASLQNPDGSWQVFDYDSQGRLSKVLASWKDVALTAATESNCRRTESSYTPVDQNDDGTYRHGAPRTVSEYVEGDLVRRVWHAYVLDQATQVLTATAEQAASASATYGAAGNLRTVTEQYAAGAPVHLAGKILSVAHPDGTLDSYVYETGTFTPNVTAPGDSTFTAGSGSDLRTTHLHGTTNNPEGVAYKSTCDVKITNTNGSTVMTEQSVWTGTTYERIRWSVTENDALGHPLTTWNSNGTYSTQTWGSCCGKLSEAFADGTEYSYDYDDLRRVTSRVKEGTVTQADVAASYTYDAEGRRLSETISGDTLDLTTSTEYDVAGRVVETTDAAQLVTSYSYSSGGRITTITRPGGATEITENYMDGRVKSITGTGVVAKYYEYGATSSGLQWTLVRTGADNSPAWERITTDFLGRTFRTEKPTYDGNTLATESTYSAAGQVVKTRSYIVENSTAVAAPTLYEYDELGSGTRSGLDVNGNDALDLASSDPISDTETVYEQDTNDDWWRKTTQQTYATADSSTATVTGVHKERLTGLGGSPLVVQETRDTDVHGQETVTTVTVDAGTRTVMRIVNVPDSGTDAQTVTVNGLVQSTRTKANLTTAYAYDGLGRPTEVTYPRTGTETTHYNSLGQVDWVENAASNRTTFAYDQSTGLRTAVTDPLNTTVYTAYTSHGQVWRTWGGGTYPLEYVYDSYGRLYQLKTFRGGSGWDQSTWPTNTGTADVTTWSYHTATGQLTAKTYADSKGTTYTYDNAGRLATRTWARGASTTYSYDASTGQLTGLDYSDSTPDVAFTYDRMGRKTTVVDAVGTSQSPREFTYYSATLQEATEYIPGVFERKITRKYDSLGRNGGFRIGTATDEDADYDVSYSYDSKGRFGDVETAVPSAFSVTYGYMTNSSLVDTVSFPNGITTARSYETNRDLLSAVTNRVGQTTVSQYTYSNDAAGRRTQTGWSGTAFSQGDTITYGYSSRSEVTSATATNRSQYDFAYSYDGIGNRQEHTVAGGTPTAYTSNELNQYEVTVDPTEAFIYDDDGNLVTDGSWTYTWDAENRLVAIENAWRRAQYDYDYMGRRVRARVWNPSGGQWVLARDVRYIYDEWNLTWEETVIPGTGSDVARYTWGLDLSGTLHGAGGVGGLLNGYGITGADAVFYDGNGNVTQLLAGTTLVTHYEYDPFGNVQMVTGSPYVPFAFSTKYWDVFVGTGQLHYYGLRHYSPRLGKWVSRDPIGESGGVMLYQFAGNCPTVVVDCLGLTPSVLDSYDEVEFGPTREGRWSDWQYSGPSSSLFNGFLYRGRYQMVTETALGWKYGERQTDGALDALEWANGCCIRHRWTKELRTAYNLTKQDMNTIIESRAPISAAAAAALNGILTFDDILTLGGTRALRDSLFAAAEVTVQEVLEERGPDYLSGWFRSLGGWNSHITRTIVGAWEAGSVARWVYHLYPYEDAKVYGLGTTECQQEAARLAQIRRDAIAGLTVGGPPVVHSASE